LAFEASELETEEGLADLFAIFRALLVVPRPKVEKSLKWF
jgi:hypothetical protein